MPRATVLMTVYNAAPYLRECVLSIMQQTFTDFECWIVNDGSTDDTESVLKTFDDPRIRVFHNTENRGIAESLNTYLPLIRTQYIIRMDADDVCLPDRFEKQLAFMDSHPEVVLSGGALSYFGARAYTWTPPITHEEIAACLWFNSAVPNPAVILRSDLVIKNGLLYDTTFAHPPMEDYVLQIEAVRYGKLANLMQVMVRHREHGLNQSSIYRHHKLENMMRVYAMIFDASGVSYTPRQLELHFHFVYASPQSTTYSPMEYEAWILKLLHHYPNKTYFRAELKRRQWTFLRHWIKQPKAFFRLLVFLYKVQSGKV